MSKRWYTWCGTRLSGSMDGPKPVGFVQQSEAVQQDGHVTISWNYSGHPSVCVEARTGNNLDGWTDGWSGINRSMDDNASRIGNQRHVNTEKKGVFMWILEGLVFSEGFTRYNVCQQISVTRTVVWQDLTAQEWSILSIFFCMRMKYQSTRMDGWQAQ